MNQTFYERNVFTTQLKDKTNFLSYFWNIGGYIFAFFISNLFCAFGILLIDSSILGHNLMTNGGIQIANLGEITPFYVIADQLILSLALSLIFLIIKNKDKIHENGLFHSITFLGLVIGILVMLLFMLAAGLYQYYIADTPFRIMKIEQQQGNWFIFTFAPMLIIEALCTVFESSILFKEGSKQVSWVCLLRNLFSLIVAWALCCYTNLDLTGFIVAFAIVTLPILIFDIAYCQIKYFKTKFNFYWFNIKELIKDISIIAFNGMWSSIIKAILIIIIVFALYDKESPTLSGFYYARVNWYLFLYLMPVLTAPTHLTFQVIKNINPDIVNRFKSLSNKVEFETVWVAVLIMTAFIVTVSYFLNVPLSEFFIRNIPSSFIKTNIQQGVISQQTILYILILPGSPSFIFICLYIYFTALGNYFNDKTVWLAPKPDKKQSFKTMILSMVAVVIVVAFIVAVGFGTMLVPNPWWGFNFMGGFSFSMALVSFLTFLMSFGIWIFAKTKTQKTIKKRMLQAQFKNWQKIKIYE